MRLVLLLVTLLMGCTTTEKPIALGTTLWKPIDRRAPTDLALLTPGRPTQQEAFLIDLNGNIVRRWPIERMAVHSRLGPAGRLYAMLLATEDERVSLNSADCNELIAIDRKGRKVLSIKRPRMSHDFDFVGNHHIAVFVLDRLDRKEMKRLRLKTDLEIAYIDRISVMNEQGEESWSWELKDHLSELRLEASPIAKTLISTGNSLQYIDKNPISHRPAFLASFRNLNKVVLVEYPSGKILYQTKQGDLSRQHDATLYNEKLMVFDNNLSADIPTLYVRQWDIVSGQSIAKWHLPWWSPVTTSVMGGARRLSDGSVLVSNSMAGNLFVVSPQGQVNWSFLVMPHRWERAPYVLGTPFYRAEVYSESQYRDWMGVDSGPADNKSN